ncbi:hypothetical protein ACNPM4_10300 [Microbacterium sp. AGC62]
MARLGSRFAPMLLDLAGTGYYVTVVHALGADAASQNWEAEDEQDRIQRDHFRS